LYLNKLEGKYTIDRGNLDMRIKNYLQIPTR